MTNKTILLVEDNPDDEALTLRAFKKNNILNDVVVARDGVEALDYVFGRGKHAGRDPSLLPQLVLLDLKLPKLDGLQVLQAIRADPRTRRLPVVILTSSKEDRDLLDGYELGANSYVCKPVDFTAFAEAVRQLGIYWLLINESPACDASTALVIAVPQQAVPGRPLKILHVEDSEDDSLLVMRELRRGGFDPSCQRVDNQSAFKEALQTHDWDVIISDYSLPNYNGLTALADAREQAKDIPFILVSGTIGEAVAVNAMRAGAHDYVLKDGLSRLPVAIEREMREASGRAAQRKMIERLAISERMASTGTLAAGVAHEINNPLAVIIANLDFLSGLVEQLGQNAPGIEDRVRAIDESLCDVREAAERVRVIVHDVKLFSTPHEQERGPVDIATVIESSIRMAWNEIRHRAHLIKEYGNVPLVDSNEARLGQILLNLLVNAAQAMPEGHASDNKIYVTTRVADNGRVVIEVRDTGAGIPKHLLSRIFDPFFTTKAVGVGTGLGLSLCYRMVTDLDGDIAVESQLGVGTLFRVTLPAATEPLPATLPARTLPRPTRRARLLVVDDEPAIGRVLARNLEPYHDVLALTNGKEAILRLESGERFDAILSDLMMPEITGMEIHDELSRIAPEQAQRMIFFTGGAFTERARQFLDRVPNPRIEKPFEIVNLLAIIAGIAQ